MPSLTSIKEDHLHILLISLWVSKSMSLREFAQCSTFFSLWLKLLRLPPTWLVPFTPYKHLVSSPPLPLATKPPWVCLKARTTCMPFTTRLTCLSVLCCPWGRIPSHPPTPVSSHCLPTLVFICLWARHVPEPVLISIPHNTVYLPRYWQKGEGENEQEAGNRKRGRADWKNQRAVRHSLQMQGVMIVRESERTFPPPWCLFSVFHLRCTLPKISSCQLPSFLGPH